MTIDTKKAEAINSRFAQDAVARAMQEIGGKIADERAKDGFDVEVYHTVAIPYAKGSEEQQYLEDLLGSGTAKDPNYIDLFEKMVSGMKQALRAEGVRYFLMLNCRFDPSLEDNFLLYVLVSL